MRIVSRAFDGSGALDVVSPAPAGYPETMSPDGRYLIYHTPGDVAMLMRLGAPESARPLVSTQTPAQVLNAEISPDGHWVAYQSNETGRIEIYVRPFPATDAGPWRIPSSTGGLYPVWVRKGDELFLFFISGPPDSWMMSVRVPAQRGPGLTFDNPVRLFRAGQYQTFVAREYDVTHDGTRFLMIKPGASASFIVVKYWFDEVRAKMGIK
jgi:dipeptidyl aminopeptidase/acylaminoacyl peptidase